jgi:TATA-box binding protein (TBP) (component of TFIID and TFIIIB)
MVVLEEVKVVLFLSGSGTVVITGILNSSCEELREGC